MRCSQKNHPQLPPWGWLIWELHVPQGFTYSKHLKIKRHKRGKDITPTPYEQVGYWQILGGFQILLGNFLECFMRMGSYSEITRHQTSWPKMVASRWKINCRMRMTYAKGIFSKEDCLVDLWISLHLLWGWSLYSNFPPWKRAFVRSNIRASPAVLSMWCCILKLDEEK